MVVDQDERSRSEVLATDFPSQHYCFDAVVVYIMLLMLLLLFW